MIPSFLLVAAVVTAQYVGERPQVSAKGEEVAEKVVCTVSYSPSALFFAFVGKDAPGGTLTVQVRPGARNCTTPVSPVACSFATTSGAKAVDRLACVAHTRLTPRGGASVEVKAGEKGGGWRATLRIPFGPRLENWPFQVGTRRPTFWFGTVSYVDAAGRRTDWGTPDEPLQIGWERPAAFKEVRNALFADESVVNAYVAAKTKYAEIYDHSQKERWIGYLDPGVETFVWRQADSEKMFHERLARPVYDTFDGAMELLKYRPSHIKGDKSKKPPKVLEMAEPAKARIFAMLKDFPYVSDTLADLRRRYLCDRFMGREIALPPPPKAKRQSAAAGLRAPDADADDTGAMSLDDDELEF